MQHWLDAVFPQLLQWCSASRHLPVRWTTGRRVQDGDGQVLLDWLLPLLLLLLSVLLLLLQLLILLLLLLVPLRLLLLLLLFYYFDFCCYDGTFKHGRSLASG